MKGQGEVVAEQQGEFWAGVRAALGAGGVVGYPSETVWGLGVRPPFAGVLRARKGREEGKAFQVSCADVPGALGFAVPSPALLALLGLLPGPLTVVTRARPGVPQEVAPGGWVGLRVPDHALAQALLGATGPLLTSSLNPAGRGAALNFEQARAYGLADVLLGGPGDVAGGLASTVVQLPADMEGEARVLRAGAFAPARLREVLLPLGLKVLE